MKAKITYETKDGLCFSTIAEVTDLNPATINKYMRDNYSMGQIIEYKFRPTIKQSFNPINKRVKHLLIFY